MMIRLKDVLSWYVSGSKMEYFGICSYVTCQMDRLIFDDNIIIHIVENEDAFRVNGSV